MSLFKKIFSGNKAEEKPVKPTQPAPSPKPQAASSQPLAQPPEEKNKIQVSPGDVFIQQQATSKKDALQFIAQKMLDSGYVSADYTDALTKREAQVSTYLTNGVAIPHGAVDAKHLVNKTGLIVVQYPDGVSWNGDDVVHLAVGIAANGDEHLAVLAELTKVVMDADLSKKLGTTATTDEIIAALGGQATADAPKATAQPAAGALAIQAEAIVADKAGMHARPATLLSKMAASYKGTKVLLTVKGKTASAKSLMKILSLGIAYEDTIIVSAEGEQAQEAVDAIAAAINAGFDEDEGDNNNAEYNPLAGLSPLQNPVGKQSYTGAAASPGIAAAKVFVFKEASLVLEKTATDPADELQQLDDALGVATTQLDALYADMLKKSPNEAEIFKAHQQLIKDDSIVNTAKDIIKDGHKAAWSWDRALKDQIAALEALDDDRIKARTADMRDVANRVARILTHQEDEFSFPKDEDFILLATELTPSQTAHLGNAPIKGIATELGGPNSHMAILARALGIPAIVGAGEGLVDAVTTGEMSIVDPQSSCFIVSPDDATLKQAQQLIKDWQGIQDVENAQKYEEAVTVDGHKVEVVCNIAKPSDSASVIDNGGEGVGLLRTEFMFEASKVEPSVEEQFNALKAIAETLKDKTLIIRTADIGGDKPVSWLDMPKEDNPFLGVRGIRLSFRNEEMLRNQLMAIYRTAIWQQGQNIKSGIHIMFPMIAKLSEWDRVKAIAEAVREKIGAPYLPLGIMIEVPSAALLADHFAKEVDFFSIGSNDMTQYTLAMDRLHPQLAAEADSYTPALLRLIDMTVKGAEAEGKWVGVCGNMAADPDMAAILVGLGVKELSVSPANVPAVKFLIRSVSYEKLKAKAQKALTMGRAVDVHRLYEDRDDLR